MHKKQQQQKKTPEDESLSKISCMDVHIDLHLQEDEHVIPVCRKSTFLFQQGKGGKKGS